MNCVSEDPENCLANWCPEHCLAVTEEVVVESPRIFIIKRNRQDMRVEQDIDNWQKHSW